MSETGVTPLTALTGKLNLGILGTATAAAVALHSLPLLAVGGIAYAALVMWDLYHPAAPAAEATPVIPALQRARTELARVLADTPDTVSDHLRPALASVEELEVRAGALSARADDLQKYLSTQDRPAIEAEAGRLAALASRATDAEARTEYDHAAQTRAEQLRALDDIAQARDRSLAHLSRIVATLEALPPKIVRMRALDAAAADALGGDVSRDLSHLNEEVRLFEATLRELAGEGER